MRNLVDEMRKNKVGESKPSVFEWYTNDRGEKIIIGYSDEARKYFHKLSEKYFDAEPLEGQRITMEYINRNFCDGELITGCQVTKEGLGLSLDLTSLLDIMPKFGEFPTCGRNDSVYVHEIDIMQSQQMITPSFVMPEKYVKSINVHEDTESDRTDADCVKEWLEYARQATLQEKGKEKSPVVIHFGVEYVYAKRSKLEGQSELGMTVGYSSVEKETKNAIVEWIDEKRKNEEITGQVVRKPRV